MTTVTLPLGKTEDGNPAFRLKLTAAEPGDAAWLSDLRWHTPTEKNNWSVESFVGTNTYVTELVLVLPIFLLK